MIPLNRRLALNHGILILFIVVSAALLCGWLASSPNLNLYEDRFDPAGSPINELIALWSPEWRDPYRPVLARETTATLCYDFPKFSDHRVRIQVIKETAPGLTVNLALLQSADGTTQGLTEKFRINNIPSDMPLRDVTQAVPAAGRFQLKIEASLSAAGSLAETSALKYVRVEIQRPRQLHASGFIFMSALMLTAAGGIIWMILGCVCKWQAMRAQNAASESVGIPGSTGSGNLRLILAVSLFALLWLGWHAPICRRTEKGEFQVLPFDDRRAIANAALLLDNGFDTSQLYFRSRLRPGFLAAALPFVRLFPQKLSLVQRAPSDQFRQMWQEFDRNDGAYGKYFQREFSLVYMLYALLACALIYGLFREFGARSNAAWLGVGLAAYAWGCVMEIPITQSWSLLINVAAILAWLRATRSTQKYIPAAGAGLLMGLAVLTKETAVTSIIPILAMQAMNWLASRRAQPPNPALSFVDIGSSDSSRSDSMNSDLARSDTARSGSSRSDFARSGSSRSDMAHSGSARADQQSAIRGLVIYWFFAALLPCIWYYLFLQGMFTEVFAFKSSHLYQQSLQSYPPTAQTWARDLWQVFNWAWLLVLIGLARRIRRGLPTAADRFCLIWLLVGLLPLALPYIFPRFFQYLIPPAAWFATGSATGSAG
ncbi:MAG: hypothetical protein NTX50_25100, partial [Candidatus Sumerlaeota bacterium]|nr:hypothetical protein [Candidatus Sumerlaeota bacterium]